MKTNVMQETICYIHKIYLPKRLNMLDTELVMLLTSFAVAATVEAVLLVRVELLVVELVAPLPPPRALASELTVSELEV
jgi:hypothetical protein